MDKRTSPVGWFEVDEVALIGSNMAFDTMENVRFIRERLKETQSRQKSYSDVRKKRAWIRGWWLDSLEDFTYEGSYVFWQEGKT